jgi:dipeptidyl aminopeptidase/acylaminoacyl peptidase
VQALGDSRRTERWCGRPPGTTPYPCWAPDGSFLIVSRHHSNLNNDLYRLDLANAGGEATLLTPHEGDARFLGVRVTPDGRYAFLATDRDGDFVRLARLDLSDGEIEYFTPDDWDVEEVELSEDGRWLACRPQRRGLLGLRALQRQGEESPRARNAAGDSRRLRVLPGRR